MWKFILHVGLCAGFFAPIFAGTIKVPPDEPLAILHLPDKWQTTEHGEMIESASPSRTMRFLVVRPEANKINESMGEVMRYIRNSGGIIVRAESLKRESEELNGMRVRHVSWLGKDKNGEVQIRFSVILVAENQPLLMAFWGSPAMQKKYRDQVNSILKSVRKA